MKIAWITTFYRTEEIIEIDRLKKEIELLHLENSRFYVSDKRTDNRGYAAGINTGLRQAYKDGCDLFIICNPDISLSGIKTESLLQGKKYFDIWGGVMKQGSKTYYGGEIDCWRMSGGLILKKPETRFASRDFVSGAFMIVKKQVIDTLGYLNEKYLIYYEEVEYCYRASRKGMKVGIDTALVYKHNEISNQINPRKDYLLARNRLIFFWQYSSFRQKIYEFIRLPKTLWEETLKRPFLLNFFTYNFSSLLVKLFSFINFLFLIRFLTVPEYGIYTLVWAQVGMLSPLSDFGTTSYGVVNLSTAKENKFHTLANLRFFLSLLIFFITAILSLIFFHNDKKIFIYILVTSTAIFANMASGTYFIWNAIKGKIYVSSRNSLIFNFILVSAIVTSLIYFHRLLGVFIIIFVFYNIYTLLNFYFIKRQLRKFYLKIDWKNWFAIIKSSYIFVLIGFFAVLYFNLDVFLLKLMKGESAVGIYSAGYNFFDALMFLAASYNVTATPILARLTGNRLQLRTRIRKDMLFLAFIGIGCVVGTILFAPILLPYILKGSYKYSIPVLKIVIFALPLILLNSVLLNTLYVLKKAYLVIFIYIFQVVLNFSLNLALIPRFSYTASAYITVFSEISNLIILSLTLRFIWKKYYGQNSS